MSKITESRKLKSSPMVPKTPQNFEDDSIVFYVINFIKVIKTLRRSFEPYEFLYYVLCDW